MWSVAWAAATWSRKATSWASSDTSATNVDTTVPAGASSSHCSLGVGHRRRRHVAHGDVAALGRQLAGQLAPHPGAAARDDGELPCELVHPRRAPPPSRPAGSLPDGPRGGQGGRRDGVPFRRARR